MNNWYKYLVYSNLWVGFAVSAFCFISMAYFHEIKLHFLIFVICSTAFAYNYMRFVQISGYDLRNNFNFKAWVASHRSEVFLLMVFFGGLSCFFFFKIYEPMVVWLLIIPGIISLVYPLSFKHPYSAFTSLRVVPGLKMFLIGATWSYVTVLVPVLLYDEIALEAILEFAMRTLLILALVIPFDIRDVPYDDRNMRTIPQVLGAEDARQLSMFFIIMYQLWVIVRFFIFHLDMPLAIALLLGLEIGYWLIKYSHRKHNENYFSFWIEGVPIFCVILFMVLRLFF